jgi:glycosyltransferase involved in cell wall biosynthesis
MSGLAERGVDVTLAAPADGVLYARAASMPVARLPLGDGVRGFATLRNALGSGRFDVVHSHASRAHGAVAVAQIGLRRRPLHVVSRRVDFPVARGPVGRWKYLDGADFYLAISEGVRRVLVDGGVDARRVRVVMSGIDLGKFEGLRARDAVRAELGLTPGILAVGNVAALAPHKAQNDLLRAAAIVCAQRSDVWFFIVGEGALRTELEALARTLGVAGPVTFTGFRSDALDLLAAFDVFALSSYLEGLGTSIMDAHALGIPVVATRTGGIPELVEDGVTGLLAPPRDAERFAAALLRFLDDPSLRTACANAARVQSSRYDYRAMVDKTLDAYRELCENRDALRPDLRDGSASLHHPDARKG